MSFLEKVRLRKKSGEDDFAREAHRNRISIGAKEKHTSKKETIQAGFGVVNKYQMKHDELSQNRLPTDFSGRENSLMPRSVSCTLP